MGYALSVSAAPGVGPKGAIQILGEAPVRPARRARRRTRSHCRSSVFTSPFVAPVRPAQGLLYWGWSRPWLGNAPRADELAAGMLVIGVVPCRSGRAWDASELTN